jgi:NAD(P)-dependent dehydrogenase (short-subunit alcohol dehydrogenase family)
MRAMRVSGSTQRPALIRSLPRVRRAVAGRIPKPFAETTLDEMDRVIDINVRGTLVATQAALKHMKPGGRIIMMGSSVGERVLVPGLVAYSATKGAVKMFSQGLSREVASRGITVNNVQPGPRRAIGRCLRRPPQRSTATGMWMRSPRWWRSSPVRSPRTLPARNSPLMVG